MQKQKYMPYFFNYKYERRTYKYIGKDYGNHIIANKGYVRNITRWFRKQLYNKNESKYKFCNTYEDWKRYLLEMPIYSGTDRENAIRYLNNHKRLCEMGLDLIKILLIPIYIAIFSVFMSLADGQSVILIMLLPLVIILASAYLIYKETSDACFYSDYIKCLENNWDISVIK